MKHLPIVSGKDVVRALGRAGFSLIRQRGSHVRMRKKLSTITLNITIPLHY
ncbi:MAG TPA: type II toxin-antitoxin system HicA family toxin [Methanoregulaceae archaeon]|nr:type II toxin-antitoxin system HicA family toxin [Methanoregulaceae archaeon]